METKSRRSQRRTMLSTGAVLVVLLLLSWVGMNPAAADAVPPANHESILNALRYAGLSASAEALDNVIWNRGFLVPPSATLLVPTNAAMEPLLASSATDDLVAVISHHIIAQNLPYDALTSLPVGTQLPTMLANDTLLVTDNNPSAFRINYQEVLPADLCTIQTVACYAVNAVLDSDEPGIITATPPIPEILPPAEAPVLPPPGLPNPPVGAPVVPPVGSPQGPPVPVGAPVVFPPPGSPGGTPGSPGGAPGSPGGAPGEPGASPPGTTPGGAPSAAVTGSPSLMAVVAATLMATMISYL